MVFFYPNAVAGVFGVVCCFVCLLTIFVALDSSFHLALLLSFAPVWRGGLDRDMAVVGALAV